METGIDSTAEGSLVVDTTSETLRPIDILAQTDYSSHGVVDDPAVTLQSACTDAFQLHRFHTQCTVIITVNHQSSLLFQ